MQRDGLVEAVAALAFDPGGGAVAVEHHRRLVETGLGRRQHRARAIGDVERPVLANTAFRRLGDGPHRLGRARDLLGLRRGTGVLGALLGKLGVEGVRVAPLEGFVGAAAADLDRLLVGFLLSRSSPAEARRWGILRMSWPPASGAKAKRSVSEDESHGHLACRRSRRSRRCAPRSSRRRSTGRARRCA